jgi:tRNA-uridine 2-sulfurtransferase
VRPVSNTVVVGPKEALATARIAGERHSWAGRAPEATAFDCAVQIRAHAEPVAATATLEDGVVTVVPVTPFDGVAPGQTAVLYDGTRVIGQFTIDRTVSAVPVLA